MLDTIYYGNSLRNWAIALALIVGSFILVRFIYWIIARWVTVLTSKTKTQLDDILINVLRRPVVVIVMLIGIYFSLGTLSFEDWLSDVFFQAYHILLAVSVSWLVSRVYKAVHDEYVTPLAERPDSDINPNLFVRLRQGLLIVIWLLGIAIGMNNAGYDVGVIVEWFGPGGPAFALILMIASYFLNRVLYWVFARWITLLAERTKTRLDDVLVDALRRPFGVVVMLIGFRLSFGTLILEEWIVILLDQMFQVSVAVSLAWFASRLYDAVHRHYIVPMSEKSDSDFDDHLLPVIRLAVRIVIWSLGIIIGLNNAGQDVGAVLAGLGIGGIAIALAAQDSVANFLGGITIIVQQPFRIGDEIEISGVRGWVRDIGLRTSVIEDFDGMMTILPNRLFTENPILNIDERKNYYVTNTLRLRHDMTLENIEMAMSVLEQIVIENELLEDKAWVSLDVIGEYSFDILFRYAIKVWRPEEVEVIGDWFQKLHLAKTQVNLAIIREFQANNIKLALPLAIEMDPPDSLSPRVF